MRSYLRPLLPLFAILVGAYWIVIFTLTHIQPPEQIDFDRFDKLIHASAYGLLAFSLAGVLTVWRGYQPRNLAGVWLLALCYGAFDEFSQQFVPNRTADLLDLLADMFGATVGLALVHVAVLAWRRMNSSLQMRPDRFAKAE